ncbi:MAG TPA: MlaD family protein [Gammaproteobacteria bacterium]|nr:MlaD family protein [Gammaproteobacteria bacterium]
MGHRVSYSVIGAFVILLGGALVVGLLWLASGGLARNYTTYVIYLKSGAASLSADSAVLYNGVAVGQVSSIQLDPKNPSQALILLKIREGTPVKTDTVAMVETRGVTGSGYVELNGGKPTAPLLEAQPGQKYAVIPTKPGTLASLANAAQSAAGRIGQIAKRLDAILSDKNVNAISESLNNIREVTANFAAQSRALDSALANLDATLANTRKATADLPALVQHLHATILSFQQLSDNARTALATVNRTASGFGQLTPQAQALLTRLNQATENLNALLQMLNANPSSLVFGKASKPGPGESKGGG